MGAPRLADLFTAYDRPSIFKLQIFAFTLLIGWQVLREVLQSGNFPELDANLLALMGVAGGVYVANQWTAAKPQEEIAALVEEVRQRKRETEGGAQDEVLVAAKEKLSQAEIKLVAKLKELADQS